MKRTNRPDAGRVRRALAHRMDYPVDAFLDTPALHFTGDNELVVEGCRSLLEYGGSRITFDLGDFTVTLVGTGLALANLSGSAMNVSGRIGSVTFDRKAGKVRP